MRFKKALPVIMIFLISLLTSCVNRKTNYFIEGSFIAENDGNLYYLDVNSISEEIFNLSNNINVVEDKVLKDNKYFAILFYTYDENRIVEIKLENLQDSNPKTNDIPISYIDSNGIGIAPFYPNENSYFYSISYKSCYLNFERRLTT